MLGFLLWLFEVVIILSFYILSCLLVYMGILVIVGFTYFAAQLLFYGGLIVAIKAAGTRRPGQD